MKFCKIAMSLLLSSIILSGCGDKGKEFTDENLGFLVGDFYAGETMLTISKEGAVIKQGNKQTALKNDFLKGDGFKTVATYVDENNKKYTINWTDGDIKQLVLKVDDTDLIYQPSLEAAKGWYTGTGESGYGYYTYITTNDFDPVTNLFIGSYAFSDYGVIYDGYRIESGFVEVGEETKLYYGFYYLDDLTEAYEHFFFEPNMLTGKLDLMYLTSPEELGFESAVTVFDYSYFDVEENPSTLYCSGLNFYGTDETNKTVYVGEDDNESIYIESYDEHGQFVTVKDMKIRGTGYGVTVETEAGVKEMPWFDYYGFYSIQSTDFVDGENTIQYGLDWDTWEELVYINGEAADTFEFTIYNHKMAIKAVKGGDTYYISLVDQETISVTINDGKPQFYLDFLSASNRFAFDYFDEDGNVISVDYDLVLTYKDTSTQCSLKYTDDFGIVLLLDGDRFIVSVSPETGIYAMVNGEDVKFIINTIFVTNFTEILLSSGTMNMLVKLDEVLLVINEEELEFTNIKYTILEVGFDMIPAIVVSNASSKYYISFSEYFVGLWEEKGASLTLTGTFVPIELLMAAVGEYVYDGKYGEEKVVFTQDFVLTVDSTNAAGTGIEPVTYTYDAFISEDNTLKLQFEYNGVLVPVDFDLQGHVNIFDIQYLIEPLHCNQGAYLMEDLGIVVSIVDNQMKISKGKESFEIYFVRVVEDVVIAYSYDEFYEEINTTLYFEDDVCTITKGLEIATANKYDLSINDFEGKYTNVSSLGYDVEIKNGEIYWGMSGEELIKVDCGYDFVYENNEMSIQFTYAGMHYTMKKVDGQPVVTGVSEVPPLPPIF